MVALPYKGCAVAQKLGYWPFIVETQVQCQAISCGICGGRSGTGAGLSPSTSVFPCQYLFTCAPCSFISLHQFDNNIIDNI